MKRVRDQGIKRTDQRTRGPEDQGTKGSEESDFFFASKFAIFSTVLVLDVFFQETYFFPGNLFFLAISSLALRTGRRAFHHCGIVTAGMATGSWRNVVVLSQQTCNEEH